MSTEVTKVGINGVDPALHNPGGVASRLKIARVHQAIPAILGVLTVASVVVLYAWDAFPTSFPARSHDFLGAFSLTMIALAYLAHQGVQRPPFREWVRAVIVIAAFAFWAGNQLWPDSHQTILLNDVAIGLFVLDVFFVLIGWPATSPDESLADMLPIARTEDPAMVIPRSEIGNVRGEAYATNDLRASASSGTTVAALGGCVARPTFAAQAFRNLCGARQRTQPCSPMTGETSLGRMPIWRFVKKCARARARRSINDRGSF